MTHNKQVMLEILCAAAVLWAGVVLLPTLVLWWADKLGDDFLTGVWAMFCVTATGIVRDGARKQWDEEKTDA